MQLIPTDWCGFYFVLTWQIVAIVELFLDFPCDRTPLEREFPNVMFKDNPCATDPRLELLGLSERYWFK